LCWRVHGVFAQHSLLVPSLNVPVRSRCCVHATVIHLGHSTNYAVLAIHLVSVVPLHLILPSPSATNSYSHLPSLLWPLPSHGKAVEDHRVVKTFYFLRNDTPAWWTRPWKTGRFIWPRLMKT
jgi:hypothetical protein